jgi:methionyl-tRNA formyltransferase
VRIAFAGTPDVAVPVLDALVSSGHEIAFVITRPDAPAGRGRVLTPSAVSLSAQEHNIECFKTTDLVSLTSQLAQVDCVVVVAFGAMVPSDLLNVPKHGWINVHFSLLPHWRGAAPVQYAIKAGDDVTGVSAFQIDSGLDTGPVLGSIATSIRAGETSGELLDRLAIEGAALMVATLSALEAENIHAVPQPTTGVSVAPKISKDDARVSWQLPALAIERHVRAMTPEPGAWTMAGDQRIKLSPVSLATEVSHLAPGEVVKIENQVFVGTGSHAVVLGEVTQAGRNQVDAKQWFSNQAEVNFE